YHSEIYRKHQRDGKLRDSSFKLDKRGVRKTIQRETMYGQDLFEKDAKLDRKETDNGLETYRRRSRSPYYKNFYHGSMQKRYPTYIYDESSRTKARVSPYRKRSPSTSVSQKSTSSSIPQHKIYNSRSPQFDNSKRRLRLNRTSCSRSDSGESYGRSLELKHYSSRKEYAYSPEYFNDRYSHNTSRYSYSFENKHQGYKKTYNYSEKQIPRNSSSLLTSSYNHSYSSKYETDHYDSKFLPKERYKNTRTSTSYYKENSDTFYRPSSTSDYQKYKHNSNSRNPKYRYVYDKDTYYRSPFSNELENNSKDTDVLYKSPDSYTETDTTKINPKKHEDTSSDLLDYKYNNMKNMDRYSQPIHKNNKLYDVNEAFTRTPQTLNFKENITKKQDNVEFHLENKQHSTTPIVSFKLSNPKSVQSTSHLHLENTSFDSNTDFSSKYKTCESKNSSTVEKLHNDAKLSKRSLSTYSALVNEEKDFLPIKKSKKLSENTLKDSENINYLETDNIQHYSKDFETKSISIVKPITKITMIDSKEGYVYERIGQVGEGTYGYFYFKVFPITAMREIKLLQSLRHPNVVCLLEMMVEKSTVYMVFEYMDHDLSGVLSNPNFHFELSHTKHLCKQMLDGLEYLHHRGVLHRDIKGSNILLDNFGQLKLADFGLARYYHKKHNTADYTNRVITLWFRPPELLLGATAYGPSVDIWSAGCIMIELFTKKPLFPGHDEIHQLELIYDMMGTPTHEKLAYCKSITM
ncbi:unnamed protein product, partial [Pneumocystis jirovecii]